ncbi:fumarylacetoacetate hydrolase family protein [Thalassospira lucentensis]|uniref:fumarylacetoacetate hydrolase family protein n=1 Tax=Thalassospira lucentensis TaxID=168935 RepID=UPI003D2EFFCE
MAHWVRKSWGRCLTNDVLERAFQLEHSGQWVKGKSADTFGPTGPWLVTCDEIADPQNLSMWLDIDNKRYQDGSTKPMVYGVAFVVSYLSSFMSLQPGDITSTGRPPGVGMGQNPQGFLKPDDVMELGVEGLSCQRQEVVQG